MENIHPITVHFTIALFTMAVLFEIAGKIYKKESLIHAAFWNLILALPAVIISVLSGINAESAASDSEAVHDIIEIHESMGFTALGFILLLLLWRVTSKGKYYKKLPLIYIIVGVIGVGLMTYGAYFGGELVYTHGVGVK